MYLYSIPETTLIIYGISIVIPLMMQNGWVHGVWENNSYFYASLPDIFSEDFKITDEINMTSLVEERKGSGPWFFST